MNAPSTQPSAPEEVMELDRHAHEWWAFLLILLLGWGVYRWQQTLHPQPPPFASAPAAARQVDWFFMIRMPPLTAQYESGIQTLRLRYAGWLEALNAAGFHPMRYSDVYEHLSRGEGVPEKTVVLVFDPGLRRTYELIAPTLLSQGWPALWLTDQGAMRHGHREYVTYHTADRMVASGWWDVGYVQSDGGVALKTWNHGALQLGGAGAHVWSPMAGGLAFNRGSSSTLLRRLNVNSDWTPEDLINRLAVEVPVQHPSFLIKRPVQNLTWGASTENALSPETRFDLQLPAHKRSFVLNWFGTEGVSDFELRAEAQRLIGKCCLRLRWDEARGNGIVLVVSNRDVSIQERVAFKYFPPVHIPAAGSGFRVHVTLHGQDMSVAAGERSLQLHGLTIPEAGRGLFQLFLSDKFRGSARVEQLQIQFIPPEASPS
jgi:hypothetical protein